MLWTKKLWKGQQQTMKVLKKPYRFGQMFFNYWMTSLNPIICESRYVSEPPHRLPPRMVSGPASLHGIWCSRDSRCSRKRRGNCCDEVPGKTGMLRFSQVQQYIAGSIFTSNIPNCIKHTARISQLILSWPKWMFIGYTTIWFLQLNGLTSLLSSPIHGQYLGWRSS